MSMKPRYPTAQAHNDTSNDHKNTQMKQLVKENRSLKDAFRKLRSNHLELRAKYDQLIKSPAKIQEVKKKQEQGFTVPKWLWFVFVPVFIGVGIYVFSSL